MISDENQSDPGGKNNQWIYYILIGIMLFAIVGVIVSDIGITKKERENIISNIKKSESDEEKYAFDTNTTLSFIRKYSLSQDENILSVSFPKELIGSDIQEIKKCYANWNLKSYDKDEIVFEKNISSYSSDCYKISSIHQDGEDFVCVYCFDIDGIPSLKNVTSFPISLLDETQIEKLKTGIIVKGEDELKKYMQNYED